MESHLTQYLLGVSMDKRVLSITSWQLADVHHVIRVNAIELVWCAHVYIKIYLYGKCKCNLIKSCRLLNLY